MIIDNTLVGYAIGFIKENNYAIKHVRSIMKGACTKIVQNLVNSYWDSKKMQFYSFEGNNDPLIQAKKLSQRNIIPFLEIDYIDSFGKEVMKQRSLHGMKNGLMLIHKQHQLNYMIVLATGFSKFNHYSFLTKYYTQLGRLKNDLSKIIEREINTVLN
jgi:hypothetical protein